MQKFLLVLLSVVCANLSQAQEKSVFKGESEASAIVISGNIDSETIGAKTKNTWNMTDLDLASIFGSYLVTKTAGTETAKAWTAGLRYERIITIDQFSGFLQHMAEHDPYNGVFTQRNSTDIGGKYFFTKSDSLTWFAELGYRYSSIYDGVLTSDTRNTDYARIYTEITSKFNTSTAGKLWGEYLSDLKDTDKSLWNAEASVTVVMTTLLSLKMSYLVNHNEGTLPPNKKDTTTWITALVANY